MVGAAARGTSCSSPRSRASRPGRAPRSTRRRSSGCAGSRSRCARTWRTHGVGVSCVLPGFVRDAGMFADSGASLPPGVGTVDARGGRRRRSSARSSATAPRSTSPRSGCGRRADRPAWRRRSPRRVQRAARRRQGRARDRRRPARAALSEHGAPSPDAAAPARRALVATPARALALTVLAGAAISLQAYINGRLGGRIGSADGRRGDQQPRRGRRDAGGRARHRRAAAGGSRGCGRWAGRRSGTSSAASSARRSCCVSAFAAPEVGVALLTVAIVCGSTLRQPARRRRRARARGAAPDHAAARRGRRCWRSRRR